MIQDQLLCGRQGSTPALRRVDELADRLLAEVGFIEVPRADLPAHRVTAPVVDAGGGVAPALAFLLAGVVIVAVQTDVVAVCLAIHGVVGEEGESSERL